MLISYTCHQPMLYAPIYLWARWASVDYLVLMMDSAVSKSCHRHFKLNPDKGVSFTKSAPLNMSHRATSVQATFHQADLFFEKLERSLRETYGRHPYYDDMLGLVLTHRFGETFGAYCSRFTRNVADYLSLRTEIKDGRDFFAQGLFDASEWLAMVGEDLGATSYVCAADARRKYLRVAPFDARHIDVVPQNYVMPEYHNSGDAAVSILDLLARFHADDVREILAA